MRTAEPTLHVVTAPASELATAVDKRLARITAVRFWPGIPPRYAVGPDDVVVLDLADSRKRSG